MSDGVADLLVLDTTSAAKTLDINVGIVDVASQATILKVIDATANALTIKAGSTDVIVLDTSSGAHKLNVNIKTIDVATLID